jgi:hypothetical protein
MWIVRSGRGDVVRGVVLLSTGLLTVGLGLSVPAAEAAPGQAAPEAGTVKVDDVVIDDVSDNQPHEGCIFQIDFFNYVQDTELFAEVTFESVAPTKSAAKPR